MKMILKSLPKSNLERLTKLTMQIQIIPFKLVYNLKLINHNFGLIEVLSFSDQILSLKYQVLHLKLNSMNLNCLP